MRTSSRTYLISFLVGTAAVFVVLVVSFFALGLAADTDGWKSFEIAIGSLRLFAFERQGKTTEMSMGNGLLIVSIVAGLVNAAAAHLLRRHLR